MLSRKNYQYAMVRGLKESEKPEFYQWAIVLKDINEPTITNA